MRRLVTAVALATLAAAPQAHAFESTRRIIGDTMAVIVEQHGEQRCFLDAEHFEEQLVAAIRRQCDQEIVDWQQTQGRAYFTMRWGFGDFIAGSGTRPVNVCVAGFVVQFGRRVQARSIEPLADADHWVLVQAATTQGSIAHQMSVATRNHIYDSLPYTFDGYASSVCSGS